MIWLGMAGYADFASLQETEKHLIAIGVGCLYIHGAPHVEGDLYGLRFYSLATC